MSNPVFPAALAAKQDSSLFSDAPEDVGMSTEMEGGYQVSRARFTRAPRRTFTTGFTEISAAEKAAMDAFYVSVKGSSMMFDWTDPTSTMGGGVAKVYTVRFAPGPLQWKYLGIGPRQLWSVSFSLQQV